MGVNVLSVLLPVSYPITPSSSSTYKLLRQRDLVELHLVDLGGRAGPDGGGRKQGDQLHDGQAVATSKSRRERRELVERMSVIEMEMKIAMEREMEEGRRERGRWREDKRPRWAEECGERTSQQSAAPGACLPVLM